MVLFGIILSANAQTVTIHSTSFESSNDGWVGTSGDDFDWTRNTNGTSSGGTGPSTGASGNYYMYTESSNPNYPYKSAFLRSPSLSLVGVTNPQFSFYYHMYGSNMGTLNVDISTDGGASYTSIWSRSGQDQNSNGAAWKQITLNLSAYIGQTVNIRFRGLTGNGYRSDMAIDNISLIATLASGPEINLLGNGISIPSGSTNISNFINTDFGSVNVASNSLVHTFTIQNLGTLDLNLTDLSSPYIAITGLNAADFRVVTTTTATPVSAGGSTTFDIIFSPSSLGVKTATVQILNNDSNEGTYTFNIEGSGVQNFFDSDGDGVFDNVDIDDDNDGILDILEENTCKTSSISVPVNYKFLNETFGSGARTTINTTYNAVTTYCYENGTVGSNSALCPSLNDTSLNDGEYTVGSSAQIASWADDYWFKGGDHTGDTNGRMAMFNASYDPGLFYTANIVGALPNIPITYSFWVLNLDRTDAPGIATRLRPNILVEFRDVNNNLLASITTGDIPPTPAGDLNGNWINFTANLTFNVEEFNVFFYNNETGGLGNDLALDDIVISQTLCDTDSDGVADVFDLDSDNDGIPDVVEVGLGALSLGTAKIPYPAGWVDANANGMHDAAEGNIPLDSDGDGVPNFLDLDSDNDSIFDVDESGATNSLAYAGYQNGDGDISGDGVGQGPDTDFVRETDVNADGIIEYFTDGILDIYDYFNGSTFDTAFGNENQGIGNTYYVLDSDGDGLPDYIDLTSDGVTFDISHTLYAYLDADNNGTIDDNNDLEGDGIVDLFDTSDTTFGSPRDLNRKLHLCFDGRNDYAEDVALMNGWAEASIMGWIKMNPASTGMQRILGQNQLYLQLNANKSITAHATGSTLTSTVNLPVNQWVHVAATYSGSKGEFKLFINGEEIALDTGVSGSLASDTSLFTLGRLPGVNSNYYHGYMDEVKVFNKALSNNELQKMVYQEVENNSGIVRGTVIPLDVTDFVSETNVTPLDWTYLQRYFKMDVYKDDIIDDLSTATVDVGVGATIYNMKIIDVQTAPLPFVTVQSGSLPVAVNNPTNGINGNDVIAYDWSIVKIQHNNINYNAYQKHLGLFVDAVDSASNPIEFSIQNNSELNVSWYLKLDGFIDLEGESQLVQGAESVLDENSEGFIEQDQQGTMSSYNYNYWSSSVGPIGSGAGSNNLDYTIFNVLFDGTDPANPGIINYQVPYTAADGALTSPITISEYWLWKFNGLFNDYDSWIAINQNDFLKPGEGHTMKGTSGTAAITDLQNYVFKGKPYNGTIQLNLAKTDERLIGNPYASAIDASAFILDNISESGGTASSNIINGALYFWDHFSGKTHILREYVGGYATYTLMGGVKAYANDYRINNNGSSGTKVPQRYIPVNQGFFVSSVLDTVANSINTIVTGGDIKFKNSQRVFATENSGNAVFMKSSTAKKEISQEKLAEDTRPKIRLLFKSSDGFERQLLVGADENASDNFDLGYDGLLIEDYYTDYFWTFNGAKFVIQAVKELHIDQELKLGFVLNETGTTTIAIEEMENIDNSVEVYIYDKLTNKNYDLINGAAEINLEAGTYYDRFDVRFKPQKTLSVENNEVLKKGIQVFVNNHARELQINNTLNTAIQSIKIYNSLGQLQNLWNNNLNNSQLKLNVGNINTGVYFIEINTVDGSISKKVFIE
jgi:hypothetical protein